MMRPRVLSISTLFPSPAQPTLGKFVANQMLGVARTGDVDLVMLNPLGVPPWPFNLGAQYRPLRDGPATSQLGPLTVHHPRFTLIPRIGAESNPQRMVRALLPLARRLHAEKPFDLVDAQFFFPDGPAAAGVAAVLGLPLTIKARGSDIHYWSTRSRALPQLLAAAKQASAMLAVSAALKADMAALGFPAEHIHVHYTGLDRAKFRVTPRTQARAALASLMGLDLPAGAPLIVVPGALIAIKGQRFAIEALAELPGAHLALAGKGADEAVLKALVASLGLADRVHFLGQVSHDALPLLMSAANAAVLPSEREGLANVWVEALACGTPLVIPDIGGAREVVLDSDAGRIAERSGPAIAAALHEVLAADVDQDDVAKTVAGFSWDANARGLIDIWRDVASR